jgi:hypothetical protein
VKQQACSHHYAEYHFFDESPNEYSFMDEDLGLITDEF